MPEELPGRRCIVESPDNTTSDSGKEHAQFDREFPPFGQRIGEDHYGQDHSDLCFHPFSILFF